MAANTTFTLTQVDATFIIISSGVPLFATINVYSNNNGLPGTLIASDVLVSATNNVSAGTFGSAAYPVYSTSFVLNEPIELTAGKYWISIESDASSDNGSLFWAHRAYTMQDSTLPTANSSDYGSTWVIYANATTGAKYEGIYSFIGECEDLAIGNSQTTNAINVYPNPARDFLNIDAIKGIKSVEIFDLSGKKITTYASNRVNVANFTSGTYLVKVTDQSGAVTTNKIIKK